MFFGGIARRSDENEIRWGGRNGESFLRIDDDHQYHQFFQAFDLAIIRNILKRKRRSIIVRRFFSIYSSTYYEFCRNISTLNRKLYHFFLFEINNGSILCKIREI